MVPLTSKLSGCRRALAATGPPGTTDGGIGCVAGEAADADEARAGGLLGPSKEPRLCSPFWPGSLADVMRTAAAAEEKSALEETKGVA